MIERPVLTSLDFALKSPTAHKHSGTIAKKVMFRIDEGVDLDIITVKTLCITSRSSLCNLLSRVTAHRFRETWQSNVVNLKSRTKQAFPFNIGCAKKRKTLHYTEKPQSIVTSEITAMSWRAAVGWSPAVPPEHGRWNAFTARAECMPVILF